MIFTHTFAFICITILLAIVFLGGVEIQETDRIESGEKVILDFIILNDKCNQILEEL